MTPTPDLQTTLQALRSPDVRVQNEGVDRALALGAVAVPALLSLLADGSASRAQVMYALAQLGDSRAHDAFEAGLLDTDDTVRAHAAVGMAQSGHPDALRALLQTLDDAPDRLHLDLTPAALALPALGAAAAPALLDLMRAAAPMTRLHAQRAFEGLIARLGIAAPPGPAYAHDAAAPARQAAVQRWRDALDLPRTTP